MKKCILLIAVGILLMSLGISTVTDAIIINDALNDVTSYIILSVVGHACNITGAVLFAVYSNKLEDKLNDTIRQK